MHMRFIRFFCLAMLAAIGLAATGCQPQDAKYRNLLVGKWQSSKLATPLYLHDSGEWEIKQDDQTVLQYGVWELKGKTLIWSHKSGAHIISDVNTVLTLKAPAFTLRESDQSVTSFTRLP